MKQIDSKHEWTEAALDTPFRGRIHAQARSAQEAAKLPGNYVKTRELERPNGHPKHCGILVRYDEGPEGVIVRSVGSPVSPPGTIWRGSKDEYHTMWVVD